MKSRKKHTVIMLILLCAALGITVLLGGVLAKYTISWEKGFGIQITPKGGTDVLAVNDGTLFPAQTRHIVFGNALDHVDTAERLVSTKAHAGATQEDDIYTYYDEETDTVYVLCADTIYFNTDSSDLFKDLTLLESITFDNYCTTSVTDMSGMFQNCPALTQLDLTGFSTASVTDMSGMFQDCTALATVYATDTFTTANTTSSDEMFTGCLVLTGGEGTRVYPGGTEPTTQPLDKTYARIDGKDGQSGYFTDISSLRQYFRSNVLKPVSENAAYAVSGTTAWFTVANALDSSTYAQAEVAYTVTYYISKDGMDWTKYVTESKSLAANAYSVEKFEVSPVVYSGETYPMVKVEMATRSFLQEDLSAVFDFSCLDIETAYAFADGVITMTVNTKNTGGNFVFYWDSGISPDNSDPIQLFRDAQAGPAELTVALQKNTVYEFLFFVTDPQLLSNLQADASAAESVVTVIQK